MSAHGIRYRKIVERLLQHATDGLRIREVAALYGLPEGMIGTLSRFKNGVYVSPELTLSVARAMGLNKERPKLIRRVMTLEQADRWDMLTQAKRDKMIGVGEGALDYGILRGKLDAYVEWCDQWKVMLEWPWYSEGDRQRVLDWYNQRPGEGAKDGI